MVIVNFKIVMGASEAGPGWFVWLIGLLEGRAAAIFVVLAGVGMSLMSQRARLGGNKHNITQKRNTLLKRSVFLFAIGLLYIPLWPADILHFYGIYIAIGAFLLLASDKWLWRLAFAFIIVFVILMFLFDYETGWDWQSLTYIDFWTLQGMARHLFFNGFHPVIPWTAFLLVGMWLGRQDVDNHFFRIKLLVASSSIAIVAEIISWASIKMMVGNSWGVDSETVKALLGTKPMPPMPLYLFSAGAIAIAIIVSSIMLTTTFSETRWIKPFVATGQLALTLYVAHVIIGMCVLELLGLLENQTLFFAVSSAITFCIISVFFSCFWSRKFSRGPLAYISHLSNRIER